MNLPNKITLSRIFIVPIFMILAVPIPDWVVNSIYYGNNSPTDALTNLLLSSGIILLQ